MRLLLDPVSDIKSDSGYPYNNHGCAKGLKKHFDSVNWNWNDYCSITTIRNPYDRVVLIYFFSQVNSGNIWHNLFKQTGDFKTFVDRLPEYIEDVVHSLGGERYKYTGQKKISIDEFAYGQNGEKLVEHILPIESLAATLNPILESQGMTNLPEIPKINTTKHDNYRVYYSEREKKIVERIFATDFEVGKYRF